MYQRIAPDVKLGRDVKIYAFVNLYGCEIGDETRVGTFVEIQKGVRIGRRCKIQSHTFICEGVTIEDEVFVSHNVNFINDLVPRSTAAAGGLKTEAEWTCTPTLVKRRAAIGTGSVVLAGVTIGESALVGRRLGGDQGRSPGRRRGGESRPRAPDAPTSGTVSESMATMTAGTSAAPIPFLDLGDAAQGAGERAGRGLPRARCAARASSTDPR